MDRFARDQRSVLKIEVRNAAGALANADVAPSVKLTDSAGTEITGSPVTPTHPPPATGVYEVTLTPAQNAILDRYLAEATATVEAVASQKFRKSYEVVGGFLFTVDELRSFDTDITVSAFADPSVVAAREAAEERFETLCAPAFRPKGRRATLDGTGRAEILVPDIESTKVVSAKIDAGSGAVALTASELSDLVVYPLGLVVRKEKGVWTKGLRNIEILYEHGVGEAPEPVRRAHMILARAYLVPTPVHERATSLSTEGGTFRLSTAGRDGPTGIPDVDAVIAQFPQVPAVG